MCWTCPAVMARCRSVPPTLATTRKPSPSRTPSVQVVATRPNRVLVLLEQRLVADWTVVFDGQVDLAGACFLESQRDGKALPLGQRRLEAFHHQVIAAGTKRDGGVGG